MECGRDLDAKPSIARMGPGRYPGPMPASPQQRVPLQFLLDLLALVAVGLGLSRALPFLPVGDHPSAGHLNGPDAGEWAINALLVAQGSLSSVDPHRMPSFLVLTAATLGIEPDVARAGHLVGVAAWASLPFIVYALGRATGGRLVGLVAALLTLGSPPLMLSTARFGVDPVVAAVLPLALVVVAPARRWWPWAAVAGVVAALCSATHLTAVPYTLPPLLLLLVRGRDHRSAAWTRTAAAVLYVASVVVTIMFLEQLFGLIDARQLTSALSEGIDPQGGTPVDSLTLTEGARAAILGRLPDAYQRTAESLLSPFWQQGLPWAVLLVVLPLGVLGVGLAQAPPAAGAAPVAVRRRLPEPLRSRLRPATRRAWERRWRQSAERLAVHPLTATLRWVGHHTDLGSGLALLACLAPVPLLAAAGAEARYTSNLLPFAAVLLARGLVAPLGLLAGRLPLRPPWGSRTLVTLGLGTIGGIALAVNSLSAVDRSIGRLPRPDPVAVGARELATAVAAAFPGEGGVATPVREAAAHLGRPYCPRASCTAQRDVAGIVRCVHELRAQCSGEGDIPLVWFRRGPLGMGDDVLTQAVGRWAAEHYVVVDEVETKAFDAVLIAVPREAPAWEPAPEVPEIVVLRPGDPRLGGAPSPSLQQGGGAVRR